MYPYATVQSTSEKNKEKCRAQFFFLVASTSGFINIWFPTSKLCHSRRINTRPLLFLIYIDNLPLHLYCNICMLADDCIVYHAVTNMFDQISFRKILTTLRKWCDCRLLTGNQNKCKLLAFSHQCNPLAHPYKINIVHIETVQSYENLGVTLPNDLSWSAHITNIISSSNKSLSSLKHNLKQAPIYVKLLAYQTIIKRKLEYACAICSPYHAYLINELKSVQNHAIRLIHSTYSCNDRMSLLKKKRIQSTNPR